MDAHLTWQLNTSLSFGPWPLTLTATGDGAWSARLRDVDGLEDLRLTHDLDPLFTVHFADDSGLDVITGRLARPPQPRR